MQVLCGSAPPHVHAGRHYALGSRASGGHSPVNQLAACWPTDGPSACHCTEIGTLHQLDAGCLAQTMASGQPSGRRPQKCQQPSCWTSRAPWRRSPLSQRCAAEAPNNGRPRKPSRSGARQIAGSNLSKPETLTVPACRSGWASIEPSIEGLQLSDWCLLACAGAVPIRSRAAAVAPGGHV
jgi:hypothetical protein